MTKSEPPPQQPSIEYERPPVGVTFYRDICLYWREPLRFEGPRPIDEFFDQAEEVARRHSCRIMVVDLTDAKRPSAAERAHITRRWVQLMPLVDTAVVFTGQNFLLNTVARFVLAGIPQRFTVWKTWEQAMQEVHRVRQAG